jgi:hypothetical protein
MRLFDWGRIPAVDRRLPPEVSEVSFAADLDAIDPIPVHTLAKYGGMAQCAWPCVGLVGSIG